ncbi:MAG: aldose 1-epimerase family protein [Aurantimonas coralicida]|nr:aldose 1-epimerase family protein [Aurantimonas coralicida]MDE0923518.1 aldose 1-epimerase family protein [Aurantimonas coralicida]
MMETHEIGAEGVRAVICGAGAELVSLRDAAGEELLWQGGPEWPRQAPVLFPIVGKLAGNVLRDGGKTYTLGQHGFARDCRFTWIERSSRRCVLRLADDAVTRRVYPYPFVLELIYEVTEATLAVRTRVSNPGEEPLPCGVGAHPGFRWPLVDGVAKTDHAIHFDRQETGVALLVSDALLGAEKPLPFDGWRLPLSEALFARDALVMPAVASRCVTYAAHAPDGQIVRSITIGWEGYKDLGIWSRSGGAPFVCIEPWFSMASPVGWDGAFIDKPGILILPPGASRDFVWRVQLDG